VTINLAPCEVRGLEGVDDRPPQFRMIVGNQQILDLARGQVHSFERSLEKIDSDEPSCFCVVDFSVHSLNTARWKSQSCAVRFRSLDPVQLV
jgi:hypothetical protein